VNKYSMAYSTIYPHKKIFESQSKRSDATLRQYPSADPRVWNDDRFQRSIGLQDVLTRGHQPRNQNTDNLNREELLKEIDRLMQEIKHKNNELDKIHNLYKETSKKLKDMEGVNQESQKYRTQLRESEAELKRLSEIHTQNDDDKETIKSLREQIEKISKVDGAMKKLKERADEADQMETEISQLKRELQKCGHGASGDKIKIPTSQVDSETRCQQCQLYRNELNASRSMLETEEKKNVEVEAERNFLRNRFRMIEVMEAELILYKVRASLL
jgi:DNA repair exonuclease SbcCD ATPase subunit